MTDRRRYTVKAFPAMAGDTVTRSFRLPRAVDELLTAKVAEKPQGIESRTDALQDAVVCWLLMEEPSATG
jgi:hypothetical protein